MVHMAMVENMEALVDDTMEAVVIADEAMVMAYVGDGDHHAQCNNDDAHYYIKNNWQPFGKSATTNIVMEADI